MAEESTTRRQLVDAAIETIRRQGIAGASARSIAEVAGVDEAVVFSHFARLPELLAEAGRVAAQARVATFRDRFDGVTSLRDLLERGRALWAEEQQRGNVVVMSQLLAGAQVDPALAEFTGSVLQLWTAEAEQVIRRLLADSPLADLVDPVSVARAMCASFVGLSLIDDTDGDVGPFDLLAPLAGFAEALKPFERRLLYARLRMYADHQK